jgi:hypothetical protein
VPVKVDGAELGCALIGWFDAEAEGIPLDGRAESMGSLTSSNLEAATAGGEIGGFTSLMEPKVTWGPGRGLSQREMRSR